MRLKTQSGKVVSSHSSACGASSLRAKLRIDSRSCSCSSLKMKWRLLEPKSGLRTVSVDMGGTVQARPRKVNSATAYFKKEPTAPQPADIRCGLWAVGCGLLPMSEVH